MIAQRMKKKLRGKSTIKSVVDGQSLKSRSGLDRWDSCEAAAAVAADDDDGIEDAFASVWLDETDRYKILR